jgi:sulfopropanediol 3-dehydrogenase
MIYLKTAVTTAEADHQDVRDLVSVMLARIAISGEEAVRDYSRTFDKWEGDLIVSANSLKAAADQVPEKLKDDIRFAHANIRRFAEAQRATLSDCVVEILPGLMAGQKQIPVAAAGCYVPGGRYSHVASAIMTVTTAKVAGVPHIAACSPPRPGVGIPPAILFAMDLCGADVILNLGGVQGVAALAQGRYPGRAGKPVCRGSQADAVRPGRHRHVRGAHGQHGSGGCECRPGNGGL